MTRWKKIKAILHHRQCFIKTEKDLLGHNTIRGYLHDFDKICLMLLGLSPETASRLHRKFSRHHEQNGQIRDIQSAVIDWECARFSKGDKPLNAVDTWLAYYNHVPGVQATLQELGLVTGGAGKSG